MSKSGIVKRSFKSLVDVRKWIAWDDMKTGGKSVVGMAKDLFARPESAGPETFTEATERLQLTDKDLIQRMRTYLHLTIIYLLMAAALSAYMIYAIVTSHWLTTFMCLILAALLTAYAFRSHFWYTQIKQKKIRLYHKRVV